jgi:hypothetical protein
MMFGREGIWNAFHQDRRGIIVAIAVVSTFPDLREPREAHVAKKARLTVRANPRIVGKKLVIEPATFRTVDTVSA